MAKGVRAAASLLGPPDRLSGLLLFLEKIERTVQIEASTVEIEERGVKLRLTVVDTPGYGDAINCRDWYVPSALQVKRLRACARLFQCISGCGVHA